METASLLLISIRRALERRCKEALRALKERPALSTGILLQGNRLLRCQWLAISIAIEKAIGPVPTAKLGTLRETFFTDRHGKGAARMEATAAGRIDQARNLATRRQ